MLKYFGCFFRKSAAGIEPAGISEIVGALESKTLLSCHFFWYLFSIAIRVSLFSVCSAARLVGTLNAEQISYILHL